MFGIMLCMGFIIGWYAIVRLSSPWTVVKSITLPQFVAESSQATIRTLKVGCYNIAHGRGGQFEAKNWDGGSRTDKIARLKKIGKLLSEEHLEIVVLNEVDFASVWSGHIDQARVIAEEGGYPYIVQQRNIDIAIPFVSLRFGNVILSKYPITEATFLDYPNPSEVVELFTGGYKEGLVATIALPDSSQIRVAAVHLCVSSEPIRIASAKMLLEAQRQSSLPMILMGDFNTAPTGYPEHQTDEHGRNAIDLLLESQQVGTKLPGVPVPPEALTFPSERPAQIIDWIFSSSAWKIETLRVVRTPLSDHFPVMALLTKTQNP